MPRQEKQDFSLTKDEKIQLYTMLGLMGVYGAWEGSQLPLLSHKAKMGMVGDPQLVAALKKHGFKNLDEAIVMARVHKIKNINSWYNKKKRIGLAHDYIAAKYPGVINYTGHRKIRLFPHHPGVGVSQVNIKTHKRHIGMGILEAGKMNEVVQTLFHEFRHDVDVKHKGLPAFQQERLMDKARGGIKAEWDQYIYEKMPTEKRANQWGDAAMRQFHKSKGKWSTLPKELQKEVLKTTHPLEIGKAFMRGLRRVK